jgi:hypothetical protein
MTRPASHANASAISVLPRTPSERVAKDPGPSRAQHVESLESKLNRIYEKELFPISLISGDPKNRESKKAAIADLAARYSWSVDDVAEDVRLIREGADLGAKVRVRRRLSQVM